MSMRHQLNSIQGERRFAREALIPQPRHPREPDQLEETVTS
jgi:hypothetical protein